MNIILKATFLTAVLAASVNLVHSEPTNTPEYSKAQIKHMAHEAHTAQQYRTLADYFRGQQQKFDQEAHSEKQEWDRRSQNTTGRAQKYPRPVDSSKNRYEYFSYKAEDMSHQASLYENLAAKAQ
jgi:hypothetical protein